MAKGAKQIKKHTTQEPRSGMSKNSENAKVESHTKLKREKKAGIPALVISIFSLIISILAFINTYSKDYTEKVVISSASRNGYYFDGKNLVEMFQVCISNNSFNTASIVDAAIERNGDRLEINGSNFSDLPLNIDSSSSCKIAVPGIIPTDTGLTQAIMEWFGSDRYISNEEMAEFAKNCDLISYEDYSHIYSYHIEFFTAKGRNCSISFEERFYGYGGTSSGGGATGSF